jgi:hypothetical protein
VQHGIALGPGAEGERLAQVVGIAGQRSRAGRGAGGVGARGRRLQYSGVLEGFQQGARMAPPGLLQLAGGLQLFQGKVARALQQAMARRARAGVRLGMQQRLVDQPADAVQHVPLVLPGLCGHLQRHLQAEAAAEDAQTSEHPLLRGAQQPMAPVECGAQGLLARRRQPAARGEQAQPVVQPVTQALQPQQRQPRRGQFDGQRDAVQPAADVEHGGQVAGVQSELRLDRAGAVLEQRQRIASGRPLCQRLGAGSGHGQRAQPHHVLEAHAQRLLAGGQQVQPRGPLQQGSRQGRHGLHQVFAVVQHQQHLTRAQASRQHLRGVVARQPDTQAQGHPAQQQRRVVQG